MATFGRRARLLVLVLGLAGCASPAAANPVDTSHVEMPPSYLFSPSVVRVPVGTTVTWQNRDNFTHSVHLLDGSDVDKVARPGESVSIRFDKTGTYRYECSFHAQQMKGEVEVVER
jgi:plastocyanin